VTANGRRRETLGLGFLFGTMYFVQGIAEPTEGLIAQPVQSLLEEWGHTVAQVTTFAFLLASPWWIKPVYGLLSDFVPLFGQRRKSYLIITTSATVAGLLAVYLMPLGPGSAVWLFLFLLPPTLGVAFSDVVVDALMVEKGQPRGITGQLQSVQWTAINLATIITGSLGGFLTAHHLQREGFLICSVVTAMTLVLSVFLVREAPRPRPEGSFRAAAMELWGAARLPVVLGVGGFIFLWNFNPFSTRLLQHYVTREMRLGDDFYGHTVSLAAVASVVASFCYGFYCRRVPFAWLLHGSIVLGILSTAAYWLMIDRRTAAAVSLAVGFTYMTALMVQLDLAARICPPRTAATVFALLMALSNLSTSASTGAGGPLYEGFNALWGPRTAFNLLVAIGATFTAGCWLMVPLLRRLMAQREAAEAIARS
jgi:predicted MFS family arabinose efflux permease